MSRGQARFIPGEAIGSAIGWDFGDVDKASSRFAAKLAAQALAEEQAKDTLLRQSSFSEGHTKGHAEGYAEGFAQGHAQATLEGQRQLNDYIANEGKVAAESLANLFATAQNQLRDSQQAMAQGVLELACAIAQQVLRRELSVDSKVLQPVVREALSTLGSDNKAALVRMNPADMEALTEVLQQEFSHLALTLVSDSSLSRGGCVVESAGTVVDGTLEQRWRKTVSTLGLEIPWDGENAVSE